MRRNPMFCAAIVFALMLSGAGTTAFGQMYEGDANGAPPPPMMGNCNRQQMPMMPMPMPMMTMVKYYDGSVYTLAGMMLSRYDATTLMQKGMVMLQPPTSMMTPAKPDEMDNKMMMEPAPPDGMGNKPMMAMNMNHGMPVFFFDKGDAIVIGNSHFYKVQLKDMKVTKFTELPSEMMMMPCMMTKPGMMPPEKKDDKGMQGEMGMINPEMNGNNGMRCTKCGMDMMPDNTDMKGMMRCTKCGMSMMPKNPDMMGDMMGMMNGKNMMSMMLPSYDRNKGMVYVAQGMQLLAINIKTGVVARQATIMMGGTMPMPGQAQMVRLITVKKYAFIPNNIMLKKGVPVTLQFTTIDVKHGFNCPGLGIRTDIIPNKINQITFTPDKTGTFDFHSDEMADTDYKDMMGTITVTD